MGDIRIIAGRYGSRRIKAPDATARPTTDRMRESLFSSLASLRGGFEDARVLDAFAGSGALGLEALSRGAACACLVERDARVLRTLRGNVELLGCARTAPVVQADALDAAVLAARVRAHGPFDVVLLDPPYALEAAAVLTVMAELRRCGIVAADALISYEHAAGSSAAEALAEAGFDMLRERSRGAGAIAIARA